MILGMILYISFYKQKPTVNTFYLNPHVIKEASSMKWKTYPRKYLFSFTDNTFGAFTRAHDSALFVVDTAFSCANGHVTFDIIVTNTKYNFNNISILIKHILEKTCEIKNNNYILLKTIMIWHKR